MTDDPGAEIGGLDELTLAVRDLIGASRELTGRMAGVMGMNATDMAAIGELVQHGPLGAGELAERLGIRSASATVLIDRLERAGHAERVRHTDDRRRVVVVDTPAARAANLAAWLPVVRDIDRACRDLSDTERASALRLLARVTTAVDRGGRDADHRRDATGVVSGGSGS